MKVKTFTKVSALRGHAVSFTSRQQRLCELFHKLNCGIAVLAEANRSSLDKLLLAGAYKNSACAGASEAEADAASERFHKG